MSTSDTQDNREYVSLLQQSLTKEDGFMPFSAREGGVCVLFEGAVYAVDFNTYNPLKPTVFRYEGFQHGTTSLPTAVEKAFYAAIRTGLHRYLAWVVQVRNTEYLPTPLKNYLLSHPEIFTDAA